MAADEDDLDEEMDELNEHDPASAKQARKGVPEQIQLMIADFKHRATGLSGPELQAEIDLLVDRVIARRVARAPEAIRAQMREAVYGLMMSDPTMKAMVEDIRRAAKRA